MKRHYCYCFVTLFIFLQHVPRVLYSSYKGGDRSASLTKKKNRNATLTSFHLNAEQFSILVVFIISLSLLFGEYAA